ncbi:MAG: hypothetical protein ACLFPW_14260 [Spirochaetaceae bacterium]
MKSTIAMTLSLLNDPGHREEAVGRIKQLAGEGRESLDAFRRIREHLLDPAISTFGT